MSQLVAFTFGSFGDIFTILGLAWSVQQLLSSSRGASVECRLLVEYLSTFSSTMEIVKSLAFDSIAGSIVGSVAPVIGGGIAPLSRPEYKPAANVVLHALSICRRLLEAFKFKLVPYEESLLPSGLGTRNTIRTMWRKLSWVSMRQEALELRSNLEAQARNIQLILSALALPENVKLEMRSESQAQTIRLIVSERAAALNAPRYVDSGLPVGIYVTDILNVQFVVPTEWCRSSTDFDKYLCFYFETQDRKGKAFVTRGRYYLESGASNELVTPATWAEHAQTGKSILMNAVLERGGQEDPHTCPCCGKNNRVDLVRYGQEIQCSSCSTIFKVMKIYMPIPNRSESQPQVDRASSTATSSAHSAHSGVDDLYDQDISFLRRISLVPRSTLGHHMKELACRLKNRKMPQNWHTSHISCIECQALPQSSPLPGQFLARPFLENRCEDLPQTESHAQPPSKTISQYHVRSRHSTCPSIGMRSNSSSGLLPERRTMVRNSVVPGFVRPPYPHDSGDDGDRPHLKGVKTKTRRRRAFLTVREKLLDFRDDCRFLGAYVRASVSR